MKKICGNCKHSLDLDIPGDRKVFGCRESFYKKTKFDSVKKITMTSFIPVMREDDTCLKFQEKL